MYREATVEQRAANAMQTSRIGDMTYLVCLDRIGPSIWQIGGDSEARWHSGHSVLRSTN